MRKYFLFFVVLLFTTLNVKANESYNTYIKNLSTCSAYKYSANSSDSEILGWKNGACYLRLVTYKYDIQKGVDYFSLTEEQLKSYLVPSEAFVFRLTKNQLTSYQKSLLKGIQDAKNNTSVTVSTQNNQNCIKAIKSYEYKNGKWIGAYKDSYIMY